MATSVVLVKLLYTALLLFLVVGAGRELFRLWFDDALYVGTFDYSAADDTAGTKGRGFAAKVALAHTVITRQLQDYASRGQAGSPDTTYSLGPDESIGLPSSALADLALTYQNVNIGQLLSSLRNTVRQPNEIRGVVTKGETTVQVAVDWPHAPELGNQAETAFLTEARSTDEAAARQVACGVAFAQIARRSEKVAKIGRVRFCHWAEALGGYSALLMQQAEGTLGDPGPRVLQLRQQLTELLKAGVELPDIHRLRADLVDLLSSEARRPLLKAAQDDRLTYALLTDPQLRDALPDERRMRAFALARPALALSNDRLDFRAVRENWRGILESAAAQLSVAAAVGAIGHERDGLRSSAFRISNNLIVTVNFALNGVARPTGAEDRLDKAKRWEGLYFCTDEGPLPCPPQKRLAVTELVLLRDDSRIVVLRIAGSEGNAVAALRDPAVNLTTFLDQYAFVVGYPAQGAGPTVPHTLAATLLGGRGGIKRLLPGRLVALGDPLDLSPTDAAAQLTTDINTLPGTAGGPLVDLATGRVIGVHLGGRWDEEKGKFATAEAITSEFLAALRTALQPPASQSQQAPAQPSNP